jgi:hypothetical protein
MKFSIMDHGTTRRKGDYSGLSVVLVETKGSVVHSWSQPLCLGVSVFERSAYIGLHGSM